MPAVAPPIAVTPHRPTNFPWEISSNLNGEDKGAFATGGFCLVLTAANPLNLGDAVYGSAAFTVDKSNVAGNQILRAGVVVGGSPRSVQAETLEAIQRIGDVGIPAAAAADPVLVCVSGVCYVVADGIIGAWAPVKLSTTNAGRVIVAVATTDAGKVLGYAMDAAGAAGDIIRIQVAVA